MDASSNGQSGHVFGQSCGQGRRHSRVDIRRGIRVAVEFGGDWVPMVSQAEDLSLSGFSLRILEPLDLGTPVIASFLGADDDHEHFVYGLVRHCTCTSDSEWVRVGVEFRDPPAGESPESVVRRVYADAA